jgi:hypothetical protein
MDKKSMKSSMKIEMKNCTFKKLVLKFGKVPGSFRLQAYQSLCQAIPINFAIYKYFTC